MYKYIKIYSMGFEDGVKDAKYDFLKRKSRKFIKIKDQDIKSKLYDIGYIKGYRKFNKSLSFNKKI